MKSENKILNFLQKFGIAIFFLGFIADAVLQYFERAPEVKILGDNSFPAFWSLSILGIILIASPIYPTAWEKWRTRNSFGTWPQMKRKRK
ncbi:hypothetical protein [Leptospira bandrabouensis]|uniref:hypothetical protein n=1 Tax=Leptospira bandrabouensis TaxID=2484903 RepID=UPI001EE9813F|nr:hypothetical protein [Leptospira bandrabouensis]MCG6144109.1 hypothetical protein [Leptospira bandrabouensis]MCG6159770.1 hypothetical protein [Leptospira bandrabouensis]MCG6163703.1 hypothetical protein [Leptospira bandrabouensis]